MAAIIRQQFKVDPWKLTETEFVNLAIEAIYLKQLDKELMTSAFAEVIAKAFGGAKEN